MQLEPLEIRRLLASNLLVDAAGISAANSVTIDGLSYFFADNGETGRELWKSDGTIAGTTLVKDLTAGADGSELFAIFRGADDRAVFITIDRKPPVNGGANDDYTLWASDGTSGGTVKLAEFKGSFNFLAKQLGDDRVVILHNVVSPSVEQPEGSTFVDGHLWASDGTAAGTQEIKTFTAQPPTDTAPTQGWMAVSMYNTPGRVIFGIGDYSQLWSTDGTAAGTIDVTTPDLTQAIKGLQVDISHMVQLDGKVLITSRLGANKFWTADGTANGTKVIPVEFSGLIPPVQNHGAVVNGKYLFEDVHTNNDTGMIEKIIHAFDVETGELEPVYTTTGDGSEQSISIYQAGNRAIFTVGHNEGATEMWSTDGTAASNVKLAEFDGFLPVDRPVVIGNTAFFVVAEGFEGDADGQGTGWVSGWNWHAVTEPGVKTMELWRTDGTLANTGRVKNIWQGDPTGLLVSATLSQGDGKLLIRTRVQSGATSAYPNDSSANPTVYDDTSAYDDKELTFGREGASARLVNGVLQVRGSYNDDTIRIWRSQKMPDKLIVEYNGNERSFLFSSITKIVADLQDGNDYFQILEGEGQVIRTRTSILGGDGSDTILGGAGRDTILGGNSGDLIYGRGNADVILAGGGRDRVNGGVGDDQVSGGSGVDKIVGGAGVDVLFGQNAIEKLFGEDVEGEDNDDDILLI